MRRLTVVKLGGSTAGKPELDGWLAALAGSPRPLVIVPGGGPFADAVRAAQAPLGISDRAAHRMAILAMEQFGQLLLDREPRFAPAGTIEAMHEAIKARRPTVWLASTLALAAADVPASWDVTSDALAAWLATKLRADALLLVKQSDAFDARDSVAELTARGVVDAAFAAMLSGTVELRIAGPRHLASAAELLASGDLPGVPVTRLRRAG